MGKMGIVFATVAWILMGVRIISGQISTNSNIVEAFKSTDYIREDTIIDATGDISRKITNEKDKKSLAIRIAAGLGIDNELDEKIIKKNNGKTYSFTKEGQNATLKINISSIDQGVSDYHENVPYVSVRLVIKNRVDCALTYMDLLKAVMEAEGIDCDINLNLRGEIKGARNYFERDKIADGMLQSLKAKVVTQNRESNNYSIYAYSENIDQYTISCGEKINISIAESYDEIKNTTVVYLSTPFCNLDY